MKKIIMNSLIVVIAIAIVFSFTTTNTFAKGKAKTNKQIVKEYRNKHFKGYKIKYFKKWDEKKMTNRKGKKILYVEKMVSYSKGKKYGYTKDGCYIRYNKKVKKGKKVISYCIYNPKTNYIDDVIAVVDNKKIR